MKKSKALILTGFLSLFLICGIQCGRGVNLDPLGNNGGGGQITYNYYLYVPNILSNTLSSFSINVTTGALTPISGSVDFANLSSPQQLVISPNGQFLYVVNTGAVGVTAYTITPSTGLLVYKGNYGAFGGSVSAAITPDSKYLYASASTLIEGFIINSDGSLTGPTGTSNGVAINSLAISPPSNEYLFAASAGNSVLSYKINSDGSLAAGNISLSATTSSFISISSDGSKAYVTSSPQVIQYTINYSSSEAFASAVPIPLATPTLTATDPLGRFLFVGNTTSVAFSPISGGNITSGSSVGPFGGFITSVMIDPTGTWAYVVNGNNLDTIQISTATQVGGNTSLGTSPNMGAIIAVAQ